MFYECAVILWYLITGKINIIVDKVLEIHAICKHLKYQTSVATNVSSLQTTKLKKLFTLFERKCVNIAIKKMECKIGTLPFSFFRIYENTIFASTIYSQQFLSNHCK